MVESLFPYILSVHVGIVFVLVPLILWTDHLGLNWVRGKTETIDARTLQRLHRLVWAGLCGMIVTGILLAYPYTDYLFNLTPFLIKVGFVAALVVNGLVIGKLMHIATRQPFRELGKRERIPLFVSAAVSTVSWVGAILMATMLNL